MEKTDKYFKVKEIAPKVWLIDEFGLDYVYILEGAEKALVIDTGVGLGNIKVIIQSVTSLPYDVVLTHGHAEHGGGRGFFDKIYVHRGDFEFVKTLDYDSRKRFVHYVLNDQMDENKKINIEEELTVFNKEPELVPVKEGSTFNLGDRKVQVLEIYGHTPGSICLYDPKTRIMFTGDTFNPFLTLLHGETTTARERWLEGAQKILKIRGEIDYLYGGHQAPIDGSVLPDLIVCMNGILNGILEKKHIFFIGMNCNISTYGNIGIVYNEKA